MKVLIIDDEQSIVTMYSEKLTAEGFKVTSCLDGKAGLALAKKVKPDLILLDLLMPKVNGFDILTLFKNDPATEHIPVYILTNIPEDMGSDKAKQLGAEGYLFKADTEPKELSKLLKREGINKIPKNK